MLDQLHSQWGHNIIKLFFDGAKARPTFGGPLVATLRKTPSQTRWNHSRCDPRTPMSELKTEEQVRFFIFFLTLLTEV